MQITPSLSLLGFTSSSSSLLYWEEGKASWTMEEVLESEFSLRETVFVNTFSVVRCRSLKMFYFCILIACLVVLPQGQSEPRAGTRRYKPIIQVTEEIDINDITFTTSAPEFERSASHKTLEGVKPHNRLGDTSPSVFPHVTYAAPVPLEKIYSTGQPLVVPAIKYKPYKVFKVQDGYRPYKPKAHEKAKLPFEPKQYGKVVPFSSQLPTRPTSFIPSDNKNFVPSPTFSPTVLAQINSESTADIKPFVPEKVIEWQKPTKKPYHIKKPKKVPDNYQTIPGTEDFTATSEELEENLTPSSLYKESPQQSETFLSEISTLHKGGSNPNNLEGVADLKTGERVEFQMYGMDGPQSYKFGFDTGKGHNRHFRFEERDNTGKVKGHYGYLDEDGKMRIMKYEADPITGFHAGPVELSPDEN